MNQLVKITTQNGTHTVDARELHLKLENKRQFKNWFDQRVSQYDLIEGVDYQSYSQICYKPSKSGGRPTDDYYLTLDCAKELAMVENNERGKEIRRYFIAAEQQWRERMNPFMGLAVHSIGERSFYNYRSAIGAIGCNYVQQALAAQIQNNPAEFSKREGEWYVSYTYAQYMLHARQQRDIRNEIIEHQAQALSQRRQMAIR